MKKLFLLPLIILLFLGNAKAQMSCCQLASMEDYQLLGASQDFVKAHPDPLPFTFVSKMGGEMMTFKTPDGKTANGFMIKAKKKTKNWLFVYQEWWGLNDYIKKQAETFYTDLGGDVNVIAVDLYDGKVAAKREEAGKLMGEAKEDRLENIIKGAITLAGKKAKITSVGWCFGGGWSLRSALLEGKQAAGCIMYYGMPVKDVEKLKTLNTDVLGIFAGKEKWITKEVVEEFDKNMKTADKTLTYKIFDAEHGFANPSNPIFNKENSEEAYKMSLEYLKKKLNL